jgi:hypothetical protein
MIPIETLTQSFSPSESPNQQHPKKQFRNPNPRTHSMLDLATSGHAGHQAYHTAVPAAVLH